MRITEGMRFAQIQRNASRIGEQHAEASKQVMTGERLDRPSRDPMAAAELSRLRASLSSAGAHRETIRMVRGDAELSESTLAQASDLMTRARELALGGANGALSADERSVMADEVRGVKEELLRLANTRGSKGYLFGGSRTDQPAFDASGAFQGDQGEQRVDIGGSSPTVVNPSGARAFTAAGGRDVFGDLDALAAALDANDRTATAATLSGIEASQDQMTSERARSGILVARLETSDAVIEQLEFDYASRQNDIGAADPFEAITRMQALSGALERNVAVARQIMDLSLISRF